MGHIQRGPAARHGEAPERLCSATKLSSIPAKTETQAQVCTPRVGACELEPDGRSLEALFATEKCHLERTGNEHAGAIERLDAARAHLEGQTELLERLMDWRDDLCQRIWRAQLQFELVGLDVDHQDPLVAEVDAFQRVCRCLAWPTTGKGRSE
jgi:hypothetical protein